MKAFGKDLDEYRKILLMPEEYILYRFKHEEDGSVNEWWESLCALTGAKRKIAMELILKADFKSLPNTGDEDMTS